MVVFGISYVGLLVTLLEISSYVSAAPKKDPSKLPPNTAQGLSLAEAKKHPKRRAPKGTHRSAFNPPKSFDARKQWPQCKSISVIRDQGACGDCWAVAGAAVLSDRLCIASGKQDQISAMQAAGCTYPNKTALQNCNVGGHISGALRTAVLYGIATGGEYGSNAGCVPYDITNAGPKPITCATTCTNPKWKKKLPADTLDNAVDSYWVEYNPFLSDQGKIDEVVKHMKEELFYHGPIAATIKVWSKFNQWTPDKGAYFPGPDEFAPPAPDGMHAVRIIGWDVDKNNIPYWMISNSWGDIWGDKGIFWVEMGKNTILIESNVAAPIVKLDTKCSSASFCTATIDQAVRMDYKDHSSPVFLFQGDCAMQVEIKDGRLKKVGEAEPIPKKIVNAPKPPIITHRLNRDTGDLGLVNAAGESAQLCAKADKSPKYACESVPWKLGAEAFTVTETGKYYKYDNNEPATLWGGSATKTSESSSDSKLGTVFSKANVTSVQAFLDIDGTKMFVFGKDAAGKPLRGILAYPTDSTPPKWLTKPGAPNAAQAC